MNLASRLCVLAVAATGTVLAACGQKGPLTLPDTSNATPIVIREAAQAAPAAPATPSAPSTAPTAAPTAAPPTAPAPAPATAPANPTPPQR